MKKICVRPNDLQVGDLIVSWIKSTEEDSEFLLTRDNKKELYLRGPLLLMRQNHDHSFIVLTSDGSLASLNVWKLCFADLIVWRDEDG
jgi:hypothetical protein